MAQALSSAPQTAHGETAHGDNGEIEETIEAAVGARWVPVVALAELRSRGSKVVKVGRKQIALFHGPHGENGRVHACNNRCPHEGYPLAEGSLSEDQDSGHCVLTCNWHNWKFDLENGDNLTGGDALRRYPTRVEDGQVLVDVSDPPGEQRAAKALENLRDSLERYEVERMARELARVQAAGAEPLDALRAAFAWTHERLEFGSTHAHAAAADWLALRDRLSRDEAESLVPLVEILGNLSWDTLRERRFPFPEASARYDPAALVAAIDREDEPAAVAQIRGALDAGIGFAALERPLAEAALAHYQDFGHAAIYVQKTAELIDRLGPGVSEPLLLSLVRALIYAWREDLVPEFRSYADQLARWDGKGTRKVTAEDFIGLDAKRAMALAVEASKRPDALYDALLGAAAWNWLHFDLHYQERTEGPISDNKSWLSFTHAVTFANAVRWLCESTPELWPAGLLQIACFVGRNAGYSDAEITLEDWTVEAPLPWLDEQLRALFDHAEPEHIVVAHLVKTLTAVRAEIAAAPDAPWVPTLVAAMNRLLNSPIKRRHALRAARQSLKFVALEG